MAAAKVTGAPPSLSAELPAAGAAGAQVQSESFTPVAPAPKKRTGAVIASAVVVLILLGAAVYVAWLLLGRGKPAPPTPPVVVEQPVTPPPSSRAAARSCRTGRDDRNHGRHLYDRKRRWRAAEQPKHRVDLPAFYLDRAEVTNAAYKKFVDATRHKPPSNWTGSSFPDGRDNFPVTGVTWQDAADYAAWAGKRLPTEAEWEAAARGTDGRKYPWGNGFRQGSPTSAQAR